MTVVRYNFSNKWHGCGISHTYGDWRIDKYEGIDQYKVCLDTFVPYLIDQNLKLVSFENIAWKGKHFNWTKRGKYCSCCGGKRFHECDDTIPGILLKNAPNPYNLPYRLSDGKHRIEKLISKNMLEFNFYVIDYEEWFKTLKKNKVVAQEGFT